LRGGMGGIKRARWGDGPNCPMKRRLDELRGIEMWGRETRAEKKRHERIFQDGLYEIHLTSGGGKPTLGKERGPRRRRNYALGTAFQRINFSVSSGKNSSAHGPRKKKKLRGEEMKRYLRGGRSWRAITEKEMAYAIRGWCWALTARRHDSECARGKFRKGIRREKDNL